MIPTHLKVLTVQERPFTYTKVETEMETKAEMGEEGRVSLYSQKRNYTEVCGEGWKDCPKYVFNSSTGSQMAQMGAHYCCQVKNVQEKEKEKKKEEGKEKEQEKGKVKEKEKEKVKKKEQEKEKEKKKKKKKK
jgi:hypothetical protein